MCYELDRDRDSLVYDGFGSGRVGPGQLAQLFMR